MSANTGSTDTPREPFHLVVPGPLDQRTGGYLYDARMVAELDAAGRTVVVHEVDGRFPDVDGDARAALDDALAAIPDDDVVVIDGLAMGATPDVVGRHAHRLRVVALVHHPLADETGVSEADRRHFEATERDALAHARGVVVTSPYTARRLAAFGVNADRVRAVTPGTEPGPMAEGPGRSEPPVLICVGTLTPRKGFDVLVRALAQLDDLEWRCDCAGSLDRAPGYAREVLEAVERSRLTARVRFLGELPAGALDEVYRRATLFVLPSFYEGYGMAFAEALARGLPVVGTTGGAIPDTVPEGAGVLVEPGDANGLAAALRELLEDPGRREVLAEAARAHARALPDWGTQAGRFGEAVDELAWAGAGSAGDGADAAAGSGRG